MAEHKTEIKDYFTQPIDDLLKKFNVDQQVGLKSEQVEQLRSEYGSNALKEKERRSIFAMFISQLNDALIYVLFAAVIITFVMGEYTDAIIILIVIIINASLGVFQELKANNAIAALQKLSNPKAIVKRNGEQLELPADELVPGDIVILEAGRYVPADLRLLENANLKVDESSLTGESVPVEKDLDAEIKTDYTAIGDRLNMSFMSSLVTFGRGTGIVVATGNQTEVGKIANYLAEENNSKTPLEIRLNHLGKTLGKLAVGICVLIFVISYFQGRDLTEMFLTSVSLAVASIPEGLTAIVAIVLSIGVTKMAKQKAIIKKLPAVETLGSVNIVCSDKTGTLTQNKMTVKELFTFGDQLIDVDSEDPILPEEQLLVEGMFLASDATLDGEKKTGDPTEVALLALADSWSIDRKEIHKQQERVDELAFDSDRKMMSTLHKKEGEWVLYAKGAVDNLILKCDRVMEHGEIIPFTDAHKELVDKAVDDMSHKALRTLGFAFKPVKSKISPEEFEEDLVFVGVVGMIDPPREEVKDSIQSAKEAGIETIMITGDHKQTAFAIAKELGIAEEEKQVVTGKEINSLSVEDLSSKISDYKVFARVSPEHKVNIVKAFQANGNIVSMTGDGVNDAPSLNMADIGVAMGTTGTDVAKNSADMILADDNFSTIISAIEQGRNIYNNIKKSVIFLLSSNVGEVLAMLVAIISGMPIPLLATQLLWINLITDTLPAVALGMDPGDKSVMEEKPRSIKENFFSHGAGWRVILGGVLIGILTIVAFVIGYWEHDYSVFDKQIPEDIHDYARTMAFLTIIACQLFYSLSFRHEYKSIFQVGLFSNKYLILAILMGFGLQLILLFIPVLRDSFRLQLVSPRDWGVVILLGLVPLILNEGIKVFQRMGRK
ncbi:cation-translocating P-type ATPase [Sphingobacterium sp. 1.A.4]|uniref:cation-translocating P-type ATPase n=1 Tax=Sphingobacterium sp. 1.A.4 TaxID=2044603 RepID=UPI000C0BEB02|nr:cation-translocating P-type ATPase [Sphingobacterium sp. 1.A.4]